MTPPRGAGALGCFLTGAVVLLIADSDLVRLAAALLLLAAVFLGVAAVATPELLGRGDDDRRDADSVLND